MKKWLLRLLLAVLWIASVDFFYGTGALVGQFSLGMAEGSMARAARVWTVLSGDFVPCAGAPPLTCGFRDTTARVEVDCADYQGQGAAVLMTFGQSNSANAGRDRYFPVGPVANFNFHDGRCYRAEDPLLGPDGPGGSVWGVLADKLIAAGHYERVLLVPFGIGGSALAEWQSGAYLHPILRRATQAARDADIVPTHVLWHQGEADADAATPEAEYFAMFESLVGLLREYGVAAPVYPAVATHCEMSFVPADPASAGASAAVRAAQSRLPQIDGVFPGPDTDTIQGELYRHDNCHFNGKGMQVHARLWLEALTGGG